MTAPDLQSTMSEIAYDARATDGTTLARAWHFRNYTLRTKLIMALLIVTLIPLGLLFYLNARASRAALTNAANQALLSAASRTAASLDGFFGTNLDAISAEAQLPVLVKYLSLPAEQRSGSAEEAEVTAILRAVSRKDVVNISSYALLDRHGQNIADTYAPDIGLDEHRYDYFQIPLQTGEPYASPVILGELPGQAYVYLSSPVRDAAGEIVGVLRVGYNAKVLQRLLAQSNGLAGLDSFGVLFDEHFVHLAHGTRPETIFKAVAALDPARVEELQAARRLPDLSAAELSTDLPDLHQRLASAMDQPFFAAEGVATGGRVNQVAVATLKTQPWLVAFFQPQDVFLAPVEAQRRIAVLMVILIAGTVVVAAVGMGQLLTGPVTRLIAAAEQIIGGDLTAQAHVESGDEIGMLAMTFNRMTTQLRDLISSLEQEVAKRTHDLERQAVQLQAAAEVGRAASSIRDLDELLSQVTHLISERFGFYHAGVFLLDDAGEYAVLRAANSEGGQRMLARGHRLKVGEQGIVGYATGRREPRIALDVGADAVYFDNPDMPDTRSEMALPLIAGGHVLGALDVQSAKEGAFTQEDIAVLQVVSDQVAVAIENAYLFAGAQEALEAERRAYGELSRQSWQETLHTRPNLSFRSDERGVSNAADIWRPEMQQALREGQTTYGNGTDPQGNLPLAVPIKVRGQVVGVLDTYKPLEAGEWTSDEVALLETLTEQLSVALESARLYQDVQRSAARERLTRVITDEMRSATSVEGIVQTAVDALFNVLGTSRAFARLEAGSPAQEHENNDL